MLIVLVRISEAGARKNKRRGLRPRHLKTWRLQSPDERGSNARRDELFGVKDKRARNVRAGEGRDERVVLVAADGEAVLVE